MPLPASIKSLTEEAALKATETRRREREGK
jgi:hypothetical protein